MIIYFIIMDKAYAIKLNSAFVFYSFIPSDIKIDLDRIFPKTRRTEIENATDAVVKSQKYYAWKLLESAINKIFGVSIDSFSFYKNENGKWKCSAFEFSISHSENAVAVAISPNPIGVDLQKITLPTNLKVIERTFNESEIEKFFSLSDEEKPFYFSTVWAKKESVFKMRDKKGFLTEFPKTFTESAFSQIVAINCANYALAVATKDEFIIEYLEIK